ncbi:MAG: hypothetical protein A2Y33_05220 [Spirochaetes bacterium GWF1_51_8]|nr:MAG: hypothetical protein A2Y33_05220 [Spirochaetes bacterium GWF1_51_8]
MLNEERLEQLKSLGDELRMMNYFSEKLERADAQSDENELAELLKLIVEQCSRVEIKVRKYRKEF